MEKCPACSWKANEVLLERWEQEAHAQRRKSWSSGARKSPAVLVESLEKAVAAEDKMCKREAEAEVVERVASGEEEGR